VGWDPQSPPRTRGPLTFGALAAVGVGAVHALGTVLAGGAGALVDVELAQVPVEAWTQGEVMSPRSGRTHQPPPAAGQIPPGPPHPGRGAGFPWGRLLGALNAGLRPAIESILFTSLEEQSL